MNAYNLNTVNATNYKNASAGYLHYLLGINPTGFSYITNMGAFGAEKSVPEFYHAWFGDGTIWDRVGTSTYGPPPGFVPAGVDPTYNLDPCCPASCGNATTNALCNTMAVTPPIGQPIQKAYRDFNTSYPQNSWWVSETGIYYEASVVRLLSQFIDTNTCGTTTPLSIPNPPVAKPTPISTNTTIYPNPASNSVTIQLYCQSEKTTTITMQNSMGTTVYNQQVVTKIGKNLYTIATNNFAKGTYVIKINQSAFSDVLINKFI
jgi:endoglucanase